MKKLFVVLIMGVIVSLTGCSTAVQEAPVEVQTEVPAEVQTEVPAVPVTVLELVKGDEVMYFTMDQLKSLPAVEGLAGIMSSTGKITAPAQHKGVLLTTLLDEVGGMTDEHSVEVVASDGYSITYSPNQIRNGEYITYDVSSGDEMETIGSLQTIIAYEREGKPLSPEMEGELRLVVIGESPLQVVDGHWSVKFVNKIVLKEAVEDWVVNFKGAIEEPMDRATFESGAADGCHLRAWTDADGHVWEGIPLYYLIGRVDDEIKHGDDAFRDDLAKNGYTIDLISADGYTVTLDSYTVMRNDDIIVAYLVDGEPLVEDNFPLRLVGPELSKKQMVGGITSVVINFEGAPAAAEPTTQAAGEAPAIIGPADATLTLKGLVEIEKVFSMEDLLKLEIVNTSVEHPKKGAMDVTGVKFAEILSLVNLKADAKTATFIAGDGWSIDVPLADLQACENCLVGWDEEMLRTYMPGFDSNFWAKDLVSIEFK